jgi:hypothetical protein
VSNLCDGSDGGPVQLRNSKAYCEGRNAAANSVLVTDNPHPAGSEAHTAWGLGHVSWAENPAGPLAPPGGGDCCADAFGGGFAGVLNTEDVPAG